MAVEESIKIRIIDLIRIGAQLRIGNQYDQVQSEEHRQKCVAWYAPVQNIIQMVCPSPDNAYRIRSEEIINIKRGLTEHRGVGELTDLLDNLVIDIGLGLVSSLINRVRAETFDDFLDHAEVYYNASRKNEAGVIAGVVFEDSLRKICEKYSISQRGKSLDLIINELAKAEIISQTKAKRARVAAHVRTKATHAQWDEYDLSDVNVTIQFTREIIAEKLDC